jgi:hypothetical protein
MTTTHTAHIAREYAANIGQDYTLSDALDPDYVDAEAVAEWEAECERRERQRVNQVMFDYFFG